MRNPKHWQKNLIKVQDHGRESAPWSLTPERGIPKRLVKEEEVSEMYLQGQLQNMFDALYQLGVIDPVLKMDWQEAMADLPSYLEDVREAMRVANEFHSDIPRLVEQLKEFEPKILEYLAMEVAREFADFHSRENLH